MDDNCQCELDPVFIEGKDGWLYRQCLECGDIRRTIMRCREAVRGCVPGVVDSLLPDAPKGHAPPETPRSSLT